MRVDCGRLLLLNTFNRNMAIIVRVPYERYAIRGALASAHVEKAFGRSVRVEHYSVCAAQLAVATYTWMD